MTVCKRVLYSGHVQGVGFRWTAQELARGFQVAGWVRNLPNRQVELLAEGEPAEVERFLAAVAQCMVDHIHDHTIQDEPTSGCQGFVIR